MNISFQLVLGSFVFTTADIKKGDFVVEYTGDVISEEEGEKILNSKEDTGTYFFFFKDKAGKLTGYFFFLFVFIDCLKAGFFDKKEGY